MQRKQNCMHKHIPTSFGCKIFATLSSPREPVLMCFPFILPEIYPAYLHLWGCAINLLPMPYHQLYEMIYISVIVHYYKRNKLQKRNFQLNTFTTYFECSK